MNYRYHYNLQHLYETVFELMISGCVYTDSYIVTGFAALGASRVVMYGKLQRIHLKKKCALQNRVPLSTLVNI
jgi:hypothetical protein